LTRIRWLLIWGVFGISAISYLDRVNLSIAGRLIEAEYGLTDVQLGWVFTSFVLSYALFQAPAGRLADRFGPRRVLAVGTLWWGVFTALTGLVPSGFPHAVLVFMSVRFALGVGESVVYPASNRLVAEWIPSKERGLANGLIFAGVGAGAGLSPLLISLIIARDGWRASFVVCALIGVAAGAVWYFICRDTPRSHPWVNASEVSFIESDLPRKIQSEGKHRWVDILANKTIAALTLSYFTFGYAAYIFFSWFFIYLNKVRSLDLKTSALYGMLPFIAMAICSPLGGWISDRLSKRFGKRVGRCGVAGVGIAGAAVFIAMGPRVSEARLASIVLAGGAGMLYLSQSAFWSLTSEIGGPAAGAASGVMNMGSQLGGAITASLSPYIAAHFGWTDSFAVSAALCVLGAITWFFVDPESRLIRRAGMRPSEKDLGAAAQSISPHPNPVSGGQ
jgi:ACS family glucarate transporter-like MFS transporter